jgi:hypothetical protein
VAAFDSLTPAQLAAQIRDHVNQAQNAATRALSRTDLAKAKIEINTCENRMLTALARVDALIPRIATMQAAIDACTCDHDDGTFTVVIEGDSNNVDYGGYYIGAWKAKQTLAKVHVLSTGGAGIQTLLARIDDVLKLKPDLVYFQVAANDFGGQPAADYLAKQVEYARRLKLGGVKKVVIGQALPVWVPANMAYTSAHNSERVKLNALQNASADFDGVVKLGELPTIGTDESAKGPFYRDGVHLSDIKADGSGGHNHALTELSRVLHDLVPHSHAPSPTPTPPHDHGGMPAGWVTAASITPIPSNFDVNAWLGNAGLHTDGEGGGEGAFRLSGVPGQLLYDDPIVYPGQPGAAHLHMFYGNLDANAHSTYESLRASGRSSTDSDMINRSAYWITALMQGDKFVKLPSHITMYYKRHKATDPWFAANGLIPADIPAGFKMVFGNNYKPDGLPFPDARPIKLASFALFRNNGVIMDAQPDLTTILPIAQPGDDIYATLTTPTFWDGIHVDSPNHRSHVKYGYAKMQDPKLVVLDGFRHVLPTMTQRFRYAVTAEDKPMDWAFSSDIMMGTKPGESFHGDYAEAWDPEVRRTWHRNAIDRELNCSGCDLGNGKAGKRHPTFSFDYKPTLVPIPAK